MISEYSRGMSLGSAGRSFWTATRVVICQSRSSSAHNLHRSHLIPSRPVINPQCHTQKRITDLLEVAVAPREARGVHLLLRATRPSAVMIAK